MKTPARQVHADSFSLPADTRVFTTYACALAWQAPDGLRVHAWMISVSGERPLTEDEALARARKETVAAWPEFNGFSFVKGSTSSSVVKLGVK